MTGPVLVIGGLVSLVALALGFAWIFKFLYGFFQPLDEQIRLDRLYQFEFAGLAAGIIVWYIIIASIGEAGLLQ